MDRLRPQLTYVFLLPMLATAAAVLGYYTWETASQYEQLGKRSIAQSTLALVEERVDRIEEQIISQDNAVFHLVDLKNEGGLKESWLPLASRISPSTRAVVVLNAERKVIDYSARDSKNGRRAFLKLFRRRLLPELKLDDLPLERLRHLHTRVKRRNYLLSYKAVQHEGEPYFLVLHHDVGYLVREELTKLFGGEVRYNVVDDENRRVAGESLAGAGDYLVGRRFPTTLYRWRLQVAPDAAALLESKGRSDVVNKAALIGLSLIVILLGMVFLMYAAFKERHLNALKSDFISNVSHELKTPLSVVRMFGEMLSTGRVANDEKRQQYLEMIVNESERLSALIENVLDFAALERGQQNFELQEADLGELVMRAVDTVRYRAEREGCPISVEGLRDLPPVKVDEQAIVLVLVNLIDNAIKYAAGEPIEVSADVQRREVRVHVRDHGPGIPAESVKRVFERFYRVRREGPSIRGSGIGLSIVKHIAEAHHGRAWATNAPDGGAIFSFSVATARRAVQPASVEEGSHA